jgi:YidC/Oxa1 family membrane protein insertase
MKFMGGIFHELLYRPLFNLLVWLYQTVAFEDLGVAIILVTIIVRLILVPLYQKSIKSQREISLVQPELKEIREKYKDDKEKQTQEMMALYQRHKINPLSGIFVLLIQLPILIALYRVTLNIFNPDTYPAFYGFVSDPQTINEIAFGFLAVNASGNLIMAILVALGQFIQTRLIMTRVKKSKTATKDGESKSDQEEIAEMVNKQMMIVMPLMIGFFAFSLPVGLSIYWITSTVFTVAQEFLLVRRSTN